MRLQSLHSLGLPFLLFAILLEVIAWRLSRIDPHIELFFLNDTSLWYTRLPETIQRWQIIAAGVIASALIFLFGEYMLLKFEKMEQRRNEAGTLITGFWNSAIWRALAHFFGTFTAFLLAAFFAECGKLSVGMLRPDFYYRCMGSSLPSTFHSEVFTSNSQCSQSDVEFILNGRKSFPSEHACAGASFGWYLTLYILWNSWCIMESRPFVSELLRMSSIVPFTFALWVGVTRITDHRQHHSSVVAGWLLGLLFATLLFVTTSLRLHRTTNKGNKEYNVLVPFSQETVQ
ncbi:Lipid phosphate phosphohydrolase 3 [Galdieria sulphuraria]|uniref:Phosphatidic acid phosphatase type 2B-like protein n=1 Tax=Galdieria sulphuraria TaxID=130081 RepID=M2XPU3_GALSU|nr:phosphatidic acid phosphatase type 2B-like protein [Galdieria sulphuraria]EME32237.1 phosphatidic acid phosphatase type 2B-like protein [Galdieria sulphuraria]GJD09660.1 Lipid phosphate phosphohydrolase 3 [Galdieria sulphuraria]|eukprot:XP_005708757.1 phosphatidic acid phosphatase type 2B-like protein [Galdieria sulphuraria]